LERVGRKSTGEDVACRREGKKKTVQKGGGGVTGNVSKGGNQTTERSNSFSRRNFGKEGSRKGKTKYNERGGATTQRRRKEERVRAREKVGDCKELSKLRRRKKSEETSCGE